MSAAEDIETPAPPRPRWRCAVLGIAILALAAVLAAWLARVPIAGRFIDRTLAARGVPARYAIADLGFGRQRLTDVVIGDPARPDLVADWIETHVDIGTAGVRLSGVRAGQVRMRARLAGGRVSLGAIDRLLPPLSGTPFALPGIDLVVADARIRLETPHGLVGLRLAGNGRLDDGFQAKLAAASDRLTLGGCRAGPVRAAVTLRVRQGAPSIAGPVRAARVQCGAVRVADARADLSVALGAALDRWKGEARIATAAVRHPAGRAASVAGRITFDGTAAATLGRVTLDTGRFAGADVSGAHLALAGDYRLGGRSVFENGVIAGEAVAVSPRLLAPVARLAGTGAGTPLGPLAAQLTRAALAAGRSLSGQARFAVDGDGVVTVRRMALSSASGVRATLDAADLSYDARTGATRLAGALSMRGGGFPAVDVRLAQAAPGGPVSGTATLRRRYAAGGASIAFTPLRFRASPRGNSRFATRVTLSGPLGDGRVEGLTLPIAGLWNGRGRVAINPDCAALGFRRLALSGLVLRPATLRLCPIGAALVAADGGRLSGGAAIAAPRLAGTLGGTPVTLAAAGSRVRLGDGRFGLERVAVRLGEAERVTRLDVAALDGRWTRAGIGGRFAGAAGRIGNVPLLLSAADGAWTLARGDLGLTGTMTVSDAAADARFRPLAARDIRLRLSGGAVAARGTLYEPTRGVKVADVTLAHRLSTGRGTAELTVPGITFGDGFQPDLLTRLTYGVIADVRGGISGEGRIAWSPAGVTSTGTFRTAGTDLAAAFGPVTGIAGEIRFTDLLALESAPGQVVTVATINPGVPVTDGRIVYRTLAGSRVAVESGAWPFAGGRLTLDPTSLDFAQPSTRRLTFRIAAMDAGQFLQQFDFKNLSATGVFDGVLPMLFDESGGRIAAGRLTVRPGGGTLAYVGDLTEKDLGFWGDVAFQALKSLRYRNLDIVMNGPLAGEMITDVRFAGVSQGAGAKSNFLVRRLQKLPFVFNVKIKAPFRGLIDSAASFYDPTRLIQRNLQPLLEEQRRRTAPPVQPPASETLP